MSVPNRHSSGNRQCPRLRKAANLGREEIASLAAAGGDVDAAAVSRSRA
ncbi:MAG TPA: hypothetical protein VGG06_02115 [Thermoanaerobaculia bacterium]